MKQNTFQIIPYSKFQTQVIASLSNWPRRSLIKMQNLTFIYNFLHDHTKTFLPSLLLVLFLRWVVELISTYPPCPCWTSAWCSYARTTSTCRGLTLTHFTCQIFDLLYQKNSLHLQFAWQCYLLSDLNILIPYLFTVFDFSMVFMFKIYITVTKLTFVSSFQNSSPCACMLLNSFIYLSKLTMLI